jgi:NADPH:quinone reductase-like Zn-dependent oxidoreductase
MNVREAVITRFGGPEVLEVRRRDLALPGPGKVRLAVTAAGMSYNEVFLRRGIDRNTALPRVRPPFVAGYDVYGIAESCGPGVDGILTGRPYVALTGLGGHADGIVLPAHELVPVPEGVDPAEAVSLVLNGVTAWQMLHRTARPREGGTILVHGAGGGVGSLLVQLGRAAGLTVLGTARSQHHDWLRAQGVTPIDYTRENFVEAVRRLAPNGVDAAFDPQGGRNAVRSYTTLARGGTLVLYGDMGKLTTNQASAALGMASAMARNLLFWRRRRVRFYSIGLAKKRQPAQFREDLMQLLERARLGTLRPLIAARLPLDEVRRAHELVEGGLISGRVVLMPGGPAH